MLGGQVPPVPCRRTFLLHILLLDLSAVEDFDGHLVASLHVFRDLDLQRSAQ